MADLWEVALPHLLPAAVRALSATWRVQVRGAQHLEQGRPCVFAFWHGRMLALWPLMGRLRRPVSVLVGPMRDARIIGATLESLGSRRVLGATGATGARGLVALRHELRRGGSVALAVDGPAGPAFQARSGAVALARNTGLPLLPLGVACAEPWRWPGAWDDFWIPPPGARLELRVGRPLWVERGPRRRQELTRGLWQLQERLLALGGEPPLP